MTEENRKIVIPGEIIVEGTDFLPGEGTERQGKNVVAMRYGIAEEVNKLVKVIPLSGVYTPRRGNVVIGKVENITFNGWIINIGSANSCFLSVAEVSRYVNSDDLESVMTIGDMVVAKVFRTNRKGIDLSIKLRGFGKLDDGIIVNVNPNKVPRIIGKEGSMVNLIKEQTGCNITVGQNGMIWIKAESIEKELLGKKAILFVAEKSIEHGLTDKVKDFLEGLK